MANKKQPRTPINRECFLRVIREKNYTVEKLGEAVGRSGRTLQRCLADGEMQPELLNTIGRTIDVAPDFLAGEYDKLIEKAKDLVDDKELLEAMWTDSSNFPYSRYINQKFDYKKYIIDTLKVNNISEEQLLSLEIDKRRMFQVDLGKALNSVICLYFDVDSCGICTEVGLRNEGMVMLMATDWFK